VRGGFIRQLSAGLWTFMPIGWRVHRKIEQIIREEMDAIGGQEMLMPVLTPPELWEATGRLGIPEIFHLKDRTGREFILPLTHEETVTFHAREIRSYRELPQLWYHFQTKDRDEPRPRGGLLRLREFIMKDGYSFDRDEEGVRSSFEANREAYKRIFDRCGLETYDVQAESGIMGGKFSIDFLAPSGSGENTLVRCENGDYAGDLEVVQAIPPAAVLPDPLDAPEEIETPGVSTIEGLAEFLGIDESATSKAMPVVKPDGTVVLALVRGDDRLSETKLYDALPGASRPATDEEIRAAFGAGGGSLGPVGFSGEVIADETLREGQFVAGANRDDWHLRGVEAGRDYEARFADLREPREGDRCPMCGGALRFQTAIELGHIFNFGSFYSKPLGATFLDEDGQEKPLLGGSYGIGPARVMAAVVEQHHDEHGIRWPTSVAPYDVHVVALPGVETQADEVVAALDAAGMSVLLDDRELRAGEKFADADLIGCPLRITVGRKTLEDGAVDVRDRSTGEERRVAAAEIAQIR
jgi:prolyl-tRNA synthetase